MLEFTQGKMLHALGRIAFALEVLARRGHTGFRDCPHCGCKIASENRPTCSACDGKLPEQLIKPEHANADS